MSGLVSLTCRRSLAALWLACGNTASLGQVMLGAISMFQGRALFEYEGDKTHDQLYYWFWDATASWVGSLHMGYSSNFSQ